MKIQLVKEVTNTNNIFYHVTVDGKIKSQSITNCIHEAMERYEEIKAEIIGKRVIVLMQETIC